MYKACIFHTWTDMMPRRIGFSRTEMSKFRSSLVWDWSLASSLTSMVCCMCSSNWSAVDMSSLRGMASKVLQGSPATHDNKSQHWPFLVLLPYHQTTLQLDTESKITWISGTNTVGSVTTKILPFKMTFSSRCGRRLLWAKNQSSHPQTTIQLHGVETLRC